MRTKKSIYRQRGYEMPDGSTQIVYGNDPAPEGGKLRWDNDVVEIVTTTVHKD